MRYVFIFPLVCSILETSPVILNIGNLAIFHNKNTNVILSLCLEFSEIRKKKM